MDTREDLMYAEIWQDSTGMYRVQEEITVKVCTVYSVQGDMTGQYRYVQRTVHSVENTRRYYRTVQIFTMYSAQNWRIYDRTIQVCTVYKEIKSTVQFCRVYKEIWQYSAGLNSQKDMTGQYSYEQWTQRYDETIRACTVYNEIW